MLQLQYIINWHHAFKHFNFIWGEISPSYPTNSIKRPPPPPPPVVEKIVEKVIIEKGPDLDAIRRIILEKKRDELGRQV